MKIVTPEYFSEFHCIAAACPDSCCKEWEVDVDPAAAAVYRTLPGALGDRLREVLREDGGSTLMTITDGRCPMWRCDGLCEIQAQLGHEALCQTCREFPRLRHDYGNFVELGLELSCPEAARLIFAYGGNQTVAEIPGGDETEYDESVMAILRRSREALLSFLAEKAYPLNEALAVMLLYGHAVQAEVDGAETAVLDPQECLAAAKGYIAAADTEVFFDFFRQLEILTPQWWERLKAGCVHSGWEEKLFALARYGVERYWLQAVSDYDLICRVKFIISACILVNALGGDPVQTAQAFSKEIENNPDNVEAILDGTYTSPAFTDVNLLNLLLQT